MTEEHDRAAYYQGLAEEEEARRWEAERDQHEERELMLQALLDGERVTLHEDSEGRFDICRRIGCPPNETHRTAVLLPDSP